MNIRKIIVDKATPQTPGSDQAFAFTLNGVPTSSESAFTPVEFTLTDAQEPFVSDALSAGTYSVAETEPDGWMLDEATCVDAAGASYDPAQIDLTGPAVTVTCTFTNTSKEPPADVRQIVVDKVTPQSPGSTQVFSFTLSAVEVPDAAKIVFEPVEFTLTDARRAVRLGRPAGGRV